MEHYTFEQYLFLQRETASFLKHNLDKNWKRNLVLRLVLSVSKFKEKYQFLHTLFANSLPFCNILSQREMTNPICAFSSSASFCKPSPPCPNLYPDGRGDFCSPLLKSRRWVSSVSSFFPFLQVLCFIPCFLWGRALFPWNLSSVSSAFVRSFYKPLSSLGLCLLFSSFCLGLCLIFMLVEPFFLLFASLLFGF